MEKVADLPPLALLTFGATLAVIFAVRYFGLTAGQKTAPANSAAYAQVASVVVDSSALREATAALKETNEAIRDLSSEVDRMREELYIRRELERRRS